MAEDIEPAITEDDWNGPSLILGTTSPKLGYFVRVGDDFRHHRSALSLDIHGPANPVELSPEDRHALAAVALADQPYGFSWYDVFTLEVFAREIEADGDHTGPRFIRAIAARIAALLPPRVK